MNVTNFVSVTLALSLLLTPLGPPTVDAVDQAIDRIFDVARWVWSLVRCGHPNNWLIEGLISHGRGCTCWAIYPPPCGSQLGPLLSRAPDRTAYGDVSL